MIDALYMLLLRIFRAHNNIFVASSSHINFEFPPPPLQRKCTCAQHLVYTTMKRANRIIYAHPLLTPFAAAACKARLRENFLMWLVGHTENNRIYKWRRTAAIYAWPTLSNFIAHWLIFFCAHSSEFGWWNSKRPLLKCVKIAICDLQRRFDIHR